MTASTPDAAPRFETLFRHAPDGGMEAVVLHEFGPDGRLARTGEYPLSAAGVSGLAAFEAVARDFGLGVDDHVSVQPDPVSRVRPHLDGGIDPRILYGYGDPAVFRDPRSGLYVAAVTSNDAPDIFPVLTSPDLQAWKVAGFAFAGGKAPEWALSGADGGDFWAPEIHPAGGAYLMVFSGRLRDGLMGVGLARGSEPWGPFIADPDPLVGAGAIDAHLFTDADRRSWLVWKTDSNDVWPGLLCRYLTDEPAGLGALFDGEAGRRAAGLLVALWPWIETLRPMERFAVLRPMIDAAAADFPEFRARLQRRTQGRQGEVLARLEEVIAATTTHIMAQEIDLVRGRLVGQATSILQNDQPWEAHIIEGPWLARAGGRVLLFYSGNDFSTHRYGVGVAAADTVLGPYAKQAGPILTSTAEWVGLGHPSVVDEGGGRLRIFVHGFRPGEVGYKAFRGLLSAELTVGEIVGVA